MVRERVVGEKREEGFFRKGLRGTVPHRPPSQAWVRRCAARQGRNWRISRTRLASASLNPPQAALGSAPTADPHNPLMRPGGTPGTRWRAKSWQKPEDKRREKARPPNPTPTEGIGFWAAISAIGSVSYTHLDVYKRQLYAQPPFFLVFFRRKKALERTDGKNSKLIQFSNRVKPARLQGFWWTKRTAPRKISSRACYDHFDTLPSC